MNRFAALTLLFALTSPLAAQTADDPVIPQDKRAVAKKLALRDLDGKKRQLIELKGKVVVVNFWATWCGPCRQEMPAFTKVYAEYRDRGVEFVGAANEDQASRAKVTTFVKSLDIQFPIWIEASADHMDAFGVGPELPATVVVDPQGRLAARIKGVTDETQLRSLLDRLLPEVAAVAPASPRPATPKPQ
jgi:thiol-disulfide isomerase/thioredoxin